jgi:hypothetical protein
METKKIKSPLGDLSNAYRDNYNSKILDSPYEEELRLVPAGYSHSSRRDKASRQEVYRKLYELSVTLNKESSLFPFADISHSIRLIPDPNNPVDKNAIHLCFFSSSKLLKSCNNKDLGFIPQKISRVVKQNIEIITGGVIRRVDADFAKKLYSCEVTLYYGNQLQTTKTSLIRFTNIL